MRVLPGYGRAYLRPFDNQLHQGVADLGGLTKEVESRFTRCGSTLTEQVKLSAQMQRQSEYLRALSEKLDSGDSAARKLTQTSELQLERTTQVSEQITCLSSLLSEHVSRLNNLIAEQQELVGIFGPLRSLQSLFRIESATLDMDVRGSFQAVTEEVQRLDEEIRKSFTVQKEELESIRLEVQVTTADLAAKAAALSGRAGANQKAMASALHNLTAERETGRRREAAVSESLSLIDKAIDRISVGLQYQDITRQKIEHVQQAISGILPSQDLHKRSEIAQKSIVVARMQAMQLRAIETDLKKAGEAASSGLAAIQNQLTCIEAQGLSVDAQTQAAERMEKVLKSLVSCHGALKSTLIEAISALSHGVDTTRRFAQITTAATGTMRQFAADLRMMGLNAQIQSVQVNHGGLEVLSGEASRISIEAGLRIQQFETNLHNAASSLLEALTPVGAVAERLGYEVSGELQTLDPEKAFAEEFELRKGAIETSTVLLNQLNEQAVELGASANVAAIDRSPLEELASELERYEATLTELFPSTGSIEDVGLSSSLYTMDSERQIHEAALRKDVLSTPAPGVETVAGSESVDFFGSEDPTGETPLDLVPAGKVAEKEPPKNTPPTTDNSNVEIF